MNKTFEVANKYNDFKDYSREYTEVGRSIPRLDGPSKVTGKYQYTGDLTLPRMAWAKILRSPHAHAKIKNIDFSKALELEGVLDVLTGKDFPIDYGIVAHSANEEVLAREKVRMWGEPVAAVCAVTEEIAEKALELIDVEYELLPVVTDARKSEQFANETGVLIHEDKPSNIAHQGTQAYGDVDAILANSDVVIEDEFYQSQYTHAYIEPQAALADFDVNKHKLHLYATCQVPHYTHQQLAKVLQMPLKDIRITVPLLGGGFGGKGVAATADFITSKFSSRIGRPVKAVYERSEVFAHNQGRHPAFMKFRMGFDKDGHITGIDYNQIMVAGAYMSWGVVVLFYTAGMTHIPYVMPAAKFAGKLIYTNTNTCGAHRGLGGSQPRFAMEIMMDMAAEKLGMSPLKIRMINAIESGHTCRSMMYIPHSEFKKSMQVACDNADFENKYGKLPFGQGIGMSGGTYISGTSYTLYLSYKPHSVAMVKIEGENNVVLYCGATDIGQGCDMVMAQEAAETLGIRAEDVKVESRDTETTTFDLGTFASRVTYATGWAIRRACEAANAKLFPVAASIMGCRGEEVGVKDYQFYSIYERKRKNVDWNEVVSMYISAFGPLVTTGQYTPPRRKGIQQGGNIGHSPTFGFTCQVAEVEVDLYTGLVHVNHISEAGDLGQPINPMSCEGQVHGSIQMGLGNALLEEMRYADDGRLLNPSFHDYKLCGTLDMPEVDAVIVESFDPSAPYGGKESGEGPIQPTPSAIFNAVYDAIGYRCKEEPMTPEKVLNYLKSVGKNL
ncbi:MAG: xanthine dehydrogenase family protein molybdopterin-binding subunit [Clostridia bacterium]|nr:xanthine dehydrogenase family protein molybdopterin-binding subunit [Clostridia bacterium]